MSFEELRSGVLNLPEDQRFEIVELLLDSLPEEPAEISMDDPGFYEELNRRFANDQGSRRWEDFCDEE